MSAHAVALSVHAACGSTGLVLGPVAMLSRKRRGLHTRAGEVYHWVFLGLFGSAVALAILNWDRVWWLAFVGAGSYGLALRGYLAAKRRWKGWLQSHVAGQGGSYIAMVTALLVVNTGGRLLLAWFLPTLIGTPIVRWGMKRAGGGRPTARRAYSGVAAGLSAGPPAMPAARSVSSKSTKWLSRTIRPRSVQ